MVRTTPGWAAAVKSVLILLKAPVSDWAAKMLAEPESAAAAGEVGVAVGAVVEVVLLHAARTTPQTAAATTKRILLDAPIPFSPLFTTRLSLPGFSEPASRSGGQLDNDVGGLHGGHGDHARLEVELIGGLAGHERDEAERSRLHLDLRRDAVLDDLGHDTCEVVAGRLGPEGAGLGRLGVFCHEPGKLRAVDQAPAAIGAVGREPPRIDPPPHGVDTHAQEFCDLADPVLTHPRTLPNCTGSFLASASLSTSRSLLGELCVANGPLMLVDTWGADRILMLRQLSVTLGAGPHRDRPAAHDGDRPRRGPERGPSDQERQAAPRRCGHWGRRSRGRRRVGGTRPQLRGHPGPCRLGGGRRADRRQLDPRPSRGAVRPGRRAVCLQPDPPRRAGRRPGPLRRTPKKWLVAVGVGSPARIVQERRGSGTARSFFV